MHHEPSAERLLAHLRGCYGIDPAGATKLSVHKTYVFRVDRKDGGAWVARAFPPARPRAGVAGDAAILGFLERQDYPAERLAVDDAVSDLEPAPAEPGADRRRRHSLPPARRADRRRTRPARGGHVHTDALPRLLRLPARRYQRLGL